VTPDDRHDTDNDTGYTDPSAVPKSIHEAQAAVDRCRNLRQAITLQRVLRALQRRDAQS
jgi:hypothetical protein